MKRRKLCPGCNQNSRENVYRPNIQMNCFYHWFCNINVIPSGIGDETAGSHTLKDHLLNEKPEKLDICNYVTNHSWLTTWYSVFDTFLRRRNSNDSVFLLKNHYSHTGCDPSSLDKPHDRDERPQSTILIHSGHWTEMHRRSLITSELSRWWD